MTNPAHAEPHIIEIKTPKGLTAWLVKSPSLPMISMELAFSAGSVYEPEDQNGVANLMASLLDEGAGEYG